MTQDAQKEVIVVGAGIAGMTAALKLAQRGYDVTIYEGQDMLGGNVGSFPMIRGLCVCGHPAENHGPDCTVCDHHNCGCKTFVHWDAVCGDRGCKHPVNDHKLAKNRAVGACEECKKDVSKEETDRCEKFTPPKGEAQRWFDVYPHMFAAFYANFWSLVEDDLGISKNASFEPRTGVKVLGPDGEYAGMTDIASAKGVWQNLVNGPQPGADMVVSFYALLDLLCEPIHRKELLGDFSVAGFLASKPYITERAAELHDYLLLVVWSVHSFGISAASYRDFFSFGLPQSSPMNWVLREDSHSALIKPFEEKLEALNVKIERSRQVVEVLADEHGRIKHLKIQKTRYDRLSGLTELVKDATEVKVPVNGQVVLAVGPKAMAQLAQKGHSNVSEQKGLNKYYSAIGRGDKREREPSPPPLPRRLVEFMPELSEARQARAEPIAVANLYFKRKLPDIPTGHVSLGGSPMNLSFLDISQLWTSLKKGDGYTVLTLAASNFYGLPSAGETDLGRYRNLRAMREELQKYLPQAGFDDVDWTKSHFHTNMSGELFINDVASETWRPVTHDDRVPNLFLAGGYCLNEVGMATVEGAVMTGIHAARAIQDRTTTEPGTPIEAIKLKAYSDSTVHAMKLGMMPWAYQSKWLSTITDVMVDAADRKDPTEWGQELATLWTLPGYFAMDMWSTSIGLCKALKDEVVGDC